ncbi:chloride channel protein [Hyphomicrobium sp.]|jgi:CIC family chloride channel protein|uniref:chloride channel protein n=1 Tax=Hyphomicrobium sp. TaxID=82 RepID=UPI0035673BA5
MRFFALGRKRKPLRWAVAAIRVYRSSLRRLLRDNTFVLVLAAACVGAVSGAVASLMIVIAETGHTFLFRLAPGERLSSATQLPFVQVLFVVTLGGVFVGATYWYQSRLRHAIVDPIEANALYGGRMSLKDSAFVAFQSLLSSGFGLSLGIEGGFTQAAGAIGSKVGRLLNRRRHDVRMLVGAGAAGGIAGAFAAPFAGAAYGFELIVGSYTVATLSPVVAAAVAGHLAARLLVGHSYHIPITPDGFGGDGYVFLALFMGVACGLLSVGLMRGVTWVERLFRQSGIRDVFRPCFGGLLVGAMAIFVPHLLGSGHDAMAFILQNGWPLPLLCVVLVGKIIASALSLGSGFRGGLFSTSLFLGAATGAIVGNLGVDAGVVAPHDVAIMSLVGMASFGAAVVGAPMAMALLALEVTGDLTVVQPVLLGILAATMTVRHVFGYSFSTWRFHLRGEAILGGEDVGWVRQTTARDLMRRDLNTVPITMRLADFCSRFPIGSTKFVAVADQDAAYAGLVDIAALHADLPSENPDVTLEQLKPALQHSNDWVMASTRFDQLVHLFEQRETERLIIVDNETSKHALGYITEAFALRRYRQELEARQREIFGN